MGEGFNSLQVRSQLFGAIVDRNATAAEFTKKIGLSKASNLCGLSHGRFFRDKETDRQMKRQILRSESLAEWLWQQKFHNHNFAQLSLPPQVSRRANASRYWRPQE